MGEIISRNKIHILLLASFLVVFWTFLIPGPRVANDLPFAFPGFVKAGFNIPQTWSDRSSVDLGEFVLHALWAWPLDLTYGAVATLGLNFSILVRLLGVLPIFVLGSWSIFRLLDHFRVGAKGRFIGVLIYLLNTYSLSLIDGGQLSIGLAYVILPFVFLKVIEAVDGGLRSRLIAAISVSLLGVFDIRFLYVLAILLLIYILFSLFFLETKHRLRLTFGWLKVGFIIAVIYLGFNLYWILPSISAKAPTLPVTYTREAQTSFLNFTQLKHAVSLLQPHWYENVFGRIPPFRKEFLIIPILAFMAPILKRKNKEVWFWTIVAVVSVFLTKGANPPLPSVYPWLFTHVPGFSLFRDSTKFFFLVALSYSVLIAFTTEEIIRRFPKFRVIFPVLIGVYLLFLVRPVYLGQMTGTFSEPRYKTEYFSLADKLENDKNFGRILWIPSKAPLGFSSPDHPSVEANRLESLRPFAVGTVGSFETQNFIREANYMGELFDIAGVKYVAYPYFDPKRDDMSKEKVDYYNTFLRQIGSLPWISQKISDVPIPVFETKKNENKFFLSGNTYFVVGSDRIYQEIKNLGAKFSDNALIFAEESPGRIDAINMIGGAKIILYDKNIEDLAMSFIDKDKFIFPSAYLSFSPSTGSGSSGWWKRETVDLVWLRDFLQQKYGIDNLDFDYGGGYSIAEGNQKLPITNYKLQAGKILLARVLMSSKGGKIGFYQGDQKIDEVNTKIEDSPKITIKLTGNKDVPDKFLEYDKADFVWFNLGKLVTDGPVVIKAEGDINIVNTLVVVSDSEFNDIIVRANDFAQKDKVVFWDKLSTVQKESSLTSESAGQVSYQSIFPTHYRATIAGLKKPSTLAFSETFDSMWTANGVGSYPLYSLINGFSVDKDGVYDIYFTPQKYVLPGLVVSAVTLTSCIIILLWRRKNPASPSKKSSAV